MALRKIGIITCSNTTQELDCCSIVCLSDLARRAGKYGDYPPDDELRLSGIMSCAGCPTMAFPDKILRKVKALWEVGVTNIHFSNCMLDLCPFTGKYAAIIRREYPELNLVMGTHEPHISGKELREKCRILFADNKRMNEVILGKL